MKGRNSGSKFFFFVPKPRTSTTPLDSSAAGRHIMRLLIGLAACCSAVGSAAPPRPPLAGPLLPPATARAAPRCCSPADAPADALPTARVRAPRRLRNSAPGGQVASRPGRLRRQGKDGQERSLQRLQVSGGAHRGRRLVTPSVYMRPMMSRVREALFSMLYPTGVLRESARALDLFSGSGVVGIEARALSLFSGWTHSLAPNPPFCPWPHTSVRAEARSPSLRRSLAASATRPSSTSPLSAPGRSGPTARRWARASGSTLSRRT